jgi:ribosomal protein S18 acetylase RimI-like enzyme
MPVRVFDRPMSPAERSRVAAVVAANQRKADLRRKAAAAYDRVMGMTGDRARAEQVRAHVLGVKAPVAPLTAKAAKAGTLPATSLADPQVRSRLQQAGVVPRIPEGGLVGKVGSNLVEAAYNLPGGVYQVGKAVALDDLDTLRGHPTAKRTANVGKAIGVSTAETARHPLRRPGDTLLLALGAAGAAGGVASRVGAAGRALSAGEGVTKALTRLPSEGGSLLRKPAAPPRELRSGDLTVRARYSNNVPVRLVQKAYDRKTGFQPGAHRVAREVANGQRVTNAVERAPSHALAHAGRRLTEPQQMALRVFHEGAPIEAVIASHKANLAGARGAARGRLAHRIGVLEAAKQYVRTVDGKPVLRADFQAPRLTVPTGGYKVPRGGVGAKAFQAISDRIDRVAGDHPGGREAVLKEMGLLTDESAKFRKDAPGRIAMGERFDRGGDQVPGQIGVDFRNSDLTPTSATERVRDRTPEEAKARLASLEQDVQKRLKPVMDRMFPGYVRSRDQALRNAAQSVKGKRAAAGIDRELQYGVGGSSRSVLTDAYRKAEDEIMRHANRPNAHPSVKALAEMIAERDALQATLGDRFIAEMGGETAPSLGSVTERLGGSPKRVATVEHVGNRGRTARAFVDPNDQAVRTKIGDVTFTSHGDQIGPEYHVRYTAVLPDGTRAGHIDVSHLDNEIAIQDIQVDPAYRRKGIASALVQRARNESSDPENVTVTTLGGVRTPEGDAFVTAGRTSRSAGGAVGRTRIPDTPVRQPHAQTKPSLYRGGIPRKPGSLTHEYTGALRAAGNYRTDTSRLVAESGVEAQRYVAVERLRQRVVKAGRAERPGSGDWVPVKTEKLSAANAAKLRNILGAETDAQKMTAQELGRYQHAFEQLKAEAFPDPREYAHVEPGTSVKGVVWVPKRLLDGVNAGGGRLLNTGTRAGRALMAFDTVQNVLKAIILYAKPGYLAPNVVGNAAFNLIQQGVHAPRNWRAALTSASRYGDDVDAGVSQVMGSGVAQALAHGTGRGKLTGAVEGAGNVWAKITDDTFRKAAFYHEAHKSGYRTQEQLTGLLYDQAKRGDLTEVSGRAKSAIVDYDRLGPVERDFVRRALFVYPWVKGATVYAGHFLAEHPVQAAAYSQVANQGAVQARQDLGDVPSYARGLFKVGGSREQPLIVNPAGVNNFATPAQVAQTAFNLLTGNGGKADNAANMLSPTLQAGLAAITRRDTFTGAPLKGSAAGIFGAQILKGTPQDLLYERIKQSQGDQSNRSYRYTPATAVGQFVGGSSAPRTANRDVLNAQARREGLASLSPVQRATRRVFDERAAFLDGAKFAMPHALEHGRLPKKLRDAFNVEAERQAAYAQASDRHKPGTVEYQRARYEADLRLLVKHGLVTAERAKEVLAASQSAGIGEIKDARRAISERYYQDAQHGQLAIISHARKALIDAGAPLDGRPA